MISGLAQKSDLLVEGAFWGSWSLISFTSWYRSIEKRRSLDQPSSMSEVVKTRKLWKANKDVFVQTCSAISGVSMISSWMADVKIISLGSLGPVLGSIGFGGSALASGVKAWDHLNLLGSQLQTYINLEEGDKKKEEGMRVLQSMLNVAFYTTVTAWAALSAIHSLTGGSLLFAVADRFFYYAVLLFFTNLAPIFILPEPEKKKGCAVENGA